MVQHVHRHVVGQLVTALGTVGIVPTLQCRVHVCAVRLLLVARRNIVVVQLGCRVGACKLDDIVALVTLKNTFDRACADKPCNMVLVRMSCNDVLQLAVFTILVNILSNGFRACTYTARINKHVGLTRLDVDTISRVPTAKLQKVDGQILVLDCFHIVGSSIEIDFGVFLKQKVEPPCKVAVNAQTDNGHNQQYYNYLQCCIVAFCHGLCRLGYGFFGGRLFAGCLFLGFGGCLLGIFL